jgi:hypothetical protein
MSAIMDPRAIEREIGRIRERESNPYSSGVKTNLFNLVIFAGQGEAGAQAAAPALQHLLGKRAARVITIDGEGAGQSTGAVVSGRCFPDVRSRGVCFEEIGISGGAPGTNIGAWAPLLIRDIPVYAWRLGRPTRESLAPVLEAAEFIDKLIVDSSAGLSRASAREAIHALGAFRSAVRRSVVVSDFAWRRTHALRVQAARAFDPPETRARLGEIREVSVVDLPPAEGALFFLWLASRLGWAPGQGPTLRGSATEAKGAAGNAPAPRTAAELHFSNGEPLVLGAKPVSDGEILLAEVDSLYQDALLEDALAQAGALALADALSLADAPAPAEGAT